MRQVKSVIDREHTVITSNNFAEGTSVYIGKQHKPSESEITKMLLKEGWQPSSIKVWYDRLQGFWRWSCKLNKQ